MPSLYDASFSVRPSGPGMDARLYPYQQAAVEQPLRGWRRHSLLAHHPGAGKTPMALVLAKVQLDLGGWVTIVCPPALVQQWQDRSRAWIGCAPVRCNDCPYSIIPDSMLHGILMRPREGALVIIDEVHRFKERSSRRTRALFGGLHGGTRYPGLTLNADRVIALTGTPVIATPFDLFPLLHATGFPQARTIREFTERYCPPYSATVRVGGNRFIRETRYDRPQNLTELQELLRGFSLIRPRREEYLTQLPALTTDVYHVSIEDPAEGDEDAMEQGSLSEARRETGARKLQAAREFIDGVAQEHSHTVVWCWHQEVCEAVVSRPFGYFLHGGVQLTARDEILRQWKNEGGVLACTIGAAGTGLDGMQDVAHRAVFIEESFCPHENEQAVARLHRAGQREPVYVTRIVSNSLADRVVARANARKAANAEGTVS